MAQGLLYCNLTQVKRHYSVQALASLKSLIWPWWKKGWAPRADSLLILQVAGMELTLAGADDGGWMRGWDER